jgi:hypothetical protein
MISPASNLSLHIKHIFQLPFSGTSPANKRFNPYGGVNLSYPQDNQLKFQLCPGSYTCDKLLFSFGQVLTPASNLVQVLTPATIYLSSFVRLLRLRQFSIQLCPGSYTCDTLSIQLCPGSYTCDNFSIQLCPGSYTCDKFSIQLCPGSYTCDNLSFKFCPVLTPAAICPALTPAMTYLSSFVRFLHLRKSLSGSYTWGNLSGSYTYENFCLALTPATIYLSIFVRFLHLRQFVWLLRLR